jgi:hypothetical protein
MNERFENSYTKLENLQESNKDLEVYMNMIKKELSQKQGINEFMDFKKTVEEFYATREHIRGIHLQLKTFSPITNSEMLEDRLNDLLNRVESNYLAKYEIQDLVNQSEEKLSNFYGIIIIELQIVTIEDFEESKKDIVRLVNNVTRFKTVEEKQDSELDHLYKLNQDLTSYLDQKANIKLIEKIDAKFEDY